MQPDDALALMPQDVVSEIEADRYLDRVRSLFETCRYSDQISRMLFVDLQTSLVDEMLSKVDRMTMAWGLEARVPLLDHRVVELALSLPGAIKRNGQMGKLPLRRLAARRLGEEVAQRAKYGFNSPLESWLRADQATRSKFDSLWPVVEECGAFDTLTLREFAGNFDQRSPHSAMNLFALLVFGLWAKQRGVQAA
jgi:asparagine synthase (glutamine-hydrolysing)